MIEIHPLTSIRAKHQNHTTSFKKIIYSREKPKLCSIYKTYEYIKRPTNRTVNDT